MGDAMLLIIETDHTLNFHRRFIWNDEFSSFIAAVNTQKYSLIV